MTIQLITPVRIDWKKGNFVHSFGPISQRDCFFGGSNPVVSGSFLSVSASPVWSAPLVEWSIPSSLVELTFPTILASGDSISTNKIQVVLNGSADLTFDKYLNRRIYREKFLAINNSTGSTSAQCQSVHRRQLGRSTERWNLQRCHCGEIWLIRTVWWLWRL